MKLSYLTAAFLLTFGEIAVANTSHPLTVQDLRRQYPHTILRQVDISTFQSIQSAHIVQPIYPIQLARANTQPGAPDPAVIGHSVPDTVVFADTCKNDSGPCTQEDSAAANGWSKDPATRKTQSEELLGSPLPSDVLYQQDDVDNIRIHGYISSFASDATTHRKKKKSSSDDNDSDDNPLAVIIFAAIGVIVVGALVVVGGKIIYDMITGKRPHSLWKDWGLEYYYSSRSLGSSPSDTYFEEQHFLSGRFQLGLKRNGHGIGIGTELGYINVNLIMPDNNFKPVDAQGYYGLFGPVYKAGFNSPFSYKAEILFGGASPASIGGIAKAMAGAQLRVHRNFFLGFNIGALYLDLKPTSGLLFSGRAINDDLVLLSGFSFGWGH